ncbi:hypothetical protein Q4567_18680 [Aliiglaciecola sp. 2_MG-2023]|uniref:hypothetical protein n=1 Tax=unclassified Aliiglaciecola TaxID=2593648 RepID=UPI0026E1E43E|nr:MULTISPECIES: hypothetical protein [unclassified Aliiglaciecola]MDO6712767.1 hypothetical protein [Aliiglaciecola sp. 2_MG-2023]MDO6753834.1 hypothetical protein [Aliiglaciecola sp. 1_MG-2023]
MFRFFILLINFVLADFSLATEKVIISSYAKYVASNQLSIKGKDYTFDELMAHLEKETSQGNIIDLSISGKPSEQDLILALAAKIQQRPEYKGDGVAVFIISW